MKLSVLLLTTTALVGAHAAALQSNSSLSESPELAPRLSHSDCDDSSGSDNEGQGGKRRRSDAVKCGEILRRPGWVRIEMNRLGYRYPRCYPDDGSQQQPCQNFHIRADTKCWTVIDVVFADCPDKETKEP
ncbi:hypothetical protein F4775DRAFT_525135 [Biscogniauxia sp. FL1348]|nr:hypothetical protein F4775DRAFT_525135 [Biscogniauxia sp. FL1348]